MDRVKQFLAMFLAFAMIVTAVPANAMAAEMSGGPGDTEPVTMVQEAENGETESELPEAEGTTEPVPASKYVKVAAIEDLDAQYVIGTELSVGKLAVLRRGESNAGEAATEGNEITSEVTDDMLWTFDKEVQDEQQEVRISGVDGTQLIAEESLLTTAAEGETGTLFKITADHQSGFQFSDRNEFVLYAEEAFVTGEEGSSLVVYKRMETETNESESQEEENHGVPSTMDKGAEEIFDKTAELNKYIYTKVNRVINGNSYIIVYDNKHVLSYNGSGYKEITVNPENNEIEIDKSEEKNVLWTLDSKSSKNEYHNKNLAAPIGGVLGADGTQYNIYHNNDNQMRTDEVSSYGMSSIGYLEYNTTNSKWRTVNTSNSKITFYERKVNLTINYYLDNEWDSINSTVCSVPVYGKTVLNIPKVYTTQKLDYMTINGMSYNEEIKPIIISEDTEVNYYYESVEQTDIQIEFFLNDKMVSGYPKFEQAGVGLEKSVSKPKEVDGATFKKLLVNGTLLREERFIFHITSETIVQYYYTKPELEANKPEEPLYSDSVTGTEDFPEYPNEGSVKIKKEANSDNFNGTGVAKVELGVTGVPVKKGVDVVLILDRSGSMLNNGKLETMKTAAKEFVDTLFKDNADGTSSNNRLGMVSFASDGRVDYALKNAYSIGYIKKTIGDLEAGGATDYDAAFSNASAVLKDALETRETYVLFMTDGGPTTFTNTNGVKYHTNSETGNTAFIDNVMETPYLKGADTIRTSDVLKSTKIYSVGFGLDAPGNGWNANQAEELVQKTSSNVSKNDKGEFVYNKEGYFINTKVDTNELEEAFVSIAMSIRKAGEEAEVTDTIGNDFTLHTAPTGLSQGGATFGDQPAIEITVHDLFTKGDVGNTIDGKFITLEDVGKRKGTSNIVEKVVFGSDGKTASSNLITDTNNIIGEGKIKAKNFSYDFSTKTFSWYIGDIMEKEITLSYYVYLNGSMIGEASEGLYDTNEEAKLSYNNYLENRVSQIFEKPKMPWGGAVVNYQYYLVNEYGEPVNSAGMVVPFAYRHIIGGTGQYKIPWNGSEASGKIEAIEFVPDGYTLFDTNSTYAVRAVSAGTGSYTKAGRGTVVYKEDKPFCISTGVAFALRFESKLLPDSIVLDYGKKVSIDVTKNDKVKGAKLDSVANPSADLHGTALGSGNDTVLDDAFKKNQSVNLVNGTVIVSDSGEKKVVDYTPVRYMDSIDRFYYATSEKAMDETGRETTYYKYESVKVIPATTVYYEDNFGSGNSQNSGNGIVFSGDWKSEGTPSADKQDNGTAEGDGHPYGSDTSYEGDGTYSGGSSHVLQVKPGEGPGKVSASFTFKGTGFDIISRTDNTSCTIGVAVYDEAGNLVEDGHGGELTPLVDNYYASGCLYQIPVLKIAALPYAKYTVKISVYGTNKQTNTFYLDAIRIHNPMGTNSVDNEEFSEANSSYNTDKEANAEVTEVRNLILDAAEAPNWEHPEESTEQLNGAVFVDTKGETSKVSDYLFEGPNNEVYLKPGQSIAFDLKTDAAPASVQIGAKAPENGSAIFTIGSNQSIKKTIEVKTATDMYYDITGYVGLNSNHESKIVITNTNQSNKMIAITNLKVTYPNNKEPNQPMRVYITGSSAARAVSLTSQRMKKPEDNQDPEIKEYTVTFKDGAGIVKTQKVKEGGAAQAPVLAKSGHTLSWDKAFHNITGDLTVSAVWKANTYTITFHPNKGSVKSKSSKAVFGSSYGTLPAASRKGYTFKGWYTKASGGSHLTGTAKYATPGNVTLYAQWTKVRVGKAAVKKLANKKAKKAAVTLKKVNGAQGYTIEYAATKKFTKKTTKSVHVKANKKASITKTIPKLKKNKKYFVRAKAYKLDSLNNKVYGKYSPIKQVLIKK